MREGRVVGVGGEVLEEGGLGRRGRREGCGSRWLGVGVGLLVAFLSGVVRTVSCAGMFDSVVGLVGSL